jgi:hypothetical protein
MVGREQREWQVREGAEQRELATLNIQTLMPLELLRSYVPMS